MQDVVLRFFEGEGLVVEMEDALIRVTIPAEAARYQCVARVDDTTGVFVFYTSCPLQVPRERMAAAAELVARLNFDHVLGSLDLDVDNGLLRLKNSIDVEGEELTEGLVANLVYGTVASLDQMMPAIRAVIESSMAPTDAVRAVYGTP
jgi:hypothetical protein